MKKEHDITNPITSRLIHSWGIRWKATAWWLPLANGNYTLISKPQPYRPCLPAYNLTELGHMIPFGMFNEMKLIKLPNHYFKVELSSGWVTRTSEVEARASFLINLLESGKVRVESKKGSKVDMPEGLPVPITQ